MIKTHNGVDVRLDVLLLSTQSQPHGPHHDCEPEVHDQSHAVGYYIAMALDERTVQQREDQRWEAGFLFRDRVRRVIVL